MMKKMLLLLIAAIHLHADAMSDAFVAYLQKDYATALAILKAHEHEKNAGVDYMIARIYMDRNMSEENTSIAIRYFEKAEQEGHAFAAGKLAQLYARPGADKASLERAIDKYDSIPRQNDKVRTAKADLLFRLGRYREALSLYTLLSDHYKKAKYTYKVASMYEQGLGVKADIKMAKKLYRTAANNGSSEAMLHLAQLLTEECIDGTNPYAGKRAMNWLNKAVKKGVKGASEALKALEEDPRCTTPPPNTSRRNVGDDGTWKPASDISKTR